MSSASKNQASGHAQSQDKAAHSSAQASQPNQAQRGGQHQSGSSSQQQVYHLDPDMIGAIKIKDGLFIGDELASQDIEFVIANKVTHIINCAGKQIMNHWEPIGVAYLAFYWLDQDNQVVLDAKDEASNAIFDFIEEAVEQTESVLVHSVRGQSRATCTLAAYIMRKYRWSLLKSLEFLNSRRPDLEIRATFIHQLSAYEQRLQKKFKEEKFTSVWEDLSEQQPHITSEELILRNTFINARMGPLADFNRGVKNAQQKKRNMIKWIDEVEKERAGKKEGLKVNDFKDDLLKKKKIEKVEVHRQKSTGSIRGTLRDRKFSLSFITGVDQMDKHALFTGSQTVRGSAKESKTTAKSLDKRKKGRDQDKAVEGQKRSSSMAVGEKESSRQASTRMTQEQVEAKKQSTSKSKSAKSGQPASKGDSTRPTATPDMFYKKGEAVEPEGDDDVDEDAGEGVGLIVEGDKKAATAAAGNVVVINDEEEDDQILCGIEVDDDEGDSCSDETSKVILKNQSKDQQAASEIRQRASSGSKHLRNSRSERTRSRGGSGGSRGSRTGQRMTKPNQKEPVPQMPNNPTAAANAKELQNDSLIAFTEENESTSAKKHKEKANNSQHLWSKDEEQTGPPNAQEGKGLVQRSNNFVSVPVSQNTEGSQANKSDRSATNQPPREERPSAPAQQQQPQNITNIINNNNINNFIINDPKTVACLQAGLIPTATSVSSTGVAAAPEQSNRDDQATGHADSGQPAGRTAGQGRRVNSSTAQTNIGTSAGATGSGSSTQPVQPPAQFSRSQLQQLYQGGSRRPTAGGSAEGGPAAGPFGTRSGSNVRGVQTAPDRSHQQSTAAGSEEVMMYHVDGAIPRSAGASQAAEGQQEQRPHPGGNAQMTSKHQSKSAKTRQGGNGVIILNQHGINFNQQQNMAPQQAKGGMVSRETGKHHRGGSESQVAEPNQAGLSMPGGRAHHKRSASHQHARGPGSLSNSRQGGRNQAEQIHSGSLNEDRHFQASHGSSQVQGHAYGMPGGLSYFTHGQGQQHHKRGSHQGAGSSSGPQAGQPKMVASLVQKEMAKRHESPRSRRQIVGQFGPGGQQHATNQSAAAAVGGKKFSHQAPVSYQGPDQLDLTGVAGIGSVAVGMNMQDINKFLINDQRSGSSGGYGPSGQHSKIGNYQYRQNQGQQQIKFARGASAGAQQAKTPQGRKGIEISGNVSAVQSTPGSSLGNSQSLKPGSQNQPQNILNRTGPIKIQNRLQDTAASDDAKVALNSTLNIGRDGAEKGKPMGGAVNRFSESLNVSEAQGSIQEGGQPGGQKATAGSGVRFGNPNNQVTKVKRQLNLLNSGQGQGTLISSSTGHKQNIAWVAHRNSSVKSRAQQKHAHSAGGAGSETSIFHTRAQGHHGHGRPGTAPKQALLNNYADGGHVNAMQLGGHDGGHSRKASGQDRPLSPYTKVFPQQNSGSMGAGTYKRRAPSKKHGPQQQIQNLISPQNHPQRSGSTSFHIQFQPQGPSSSAFNQRRSQSPAANTAHHSTHNSMTLGQFQKQQMLNSGHVSNVAGHQHPGQGNAHPQFVTHSALHNFGSVGHPQVPGAGVSPYQRMQGVKRRR